MQRQRFQCRQARAGWDSASSRSTQHWPQQEDSFRPFLVQQQKRMTKSRCVPRDGIYTERSSLGNVEEPRTMLHACLFPHPAQAFAASIPFPPRRCPSLPCFLPPQPLSTFHIFHVTVKTSPVHANISDSFVYFYLFPYFSLQIYTSLMYIFPQFHKNSPLCK